MSDRPENPQAKLFLTQHMNEILKAELLRNHVLITLLSKDTTSPTIQVPVYRNEEREAERLDWLKLYGDLAERGVDEGWLEYISDDYGDTGLAVVTERIVDHYEKAPNPDYDPATAGKHKTVTFKRYAE